MSFQKSKKLSIKNLVSLAGVAGASVLLGFPVLAQVTPNSGQNNQNNLFAQGQQGSGGRLPTDDRFDNQSPNDQLNNDAGGTNRSNTNGTSQQMNQPSMTGGQQGSGGRLPTDDRFGNQSPNDQLNNDAGGTNRSNTNGTSQMNQPSMTGGQQGSGVTPNTDTNTTNSGSTDQGVQGLW